MGNLLNYFGLSKLLWVMFLFTLHLFCVHLFSCSCILFCHCFIVNKGFCSWRLALLKWCILIDQSIDHWFIYCYIFAMVGSVNYWLIFTISFARDEPRNRALAMLGLHLTVTPVLCTYCTEWNAQTVHVFCDVLWCAKQPFNVVEYHLHNIRASPGSWCSPTETRLAVTATSAASSRCCFEPSRTRPLATGERRGRGRLSACSLPSRPPTTSWASRISASWPLDCCSAPWNGLATFRSFPICRWRENYRELSVLKLSDLFVNKKNRINLKHATGGAERQRWKVLCK